MSVHTTLSLNSYGIEAFSFYDLATTIKSDAVKLASAILLLNTINTLVSVLLLEHWDSNPKRIIYNHSDE